MQSLEQFKETKAQQAATKGLTDFIGKISKAIKAKNLNIGKLFRIYTVLEKAVKDVEAIVAEK